MTESASSHADGATTDIIEERLIDAEYKIWKKNTPYLYDIVLTHSLEWPSLTCQWLPHSKRYGGPSGAGKHKGTQAMNTASIAVEHQLLLGTHTTGDEPNYLMIATCVLPSEKEEVISSELQASEVAETASKLRYDEEKREVGGYGLAGADVGKIEVKMKIKHEGEVNRARYMPQNHFIVATRGPSPELYIWDVSKHPSFPDEKSVFCPQCVCVGHEKEGYAMAWSPFNEGNLLSGGEDMTVKLWDVSAVYKSGASSSGNQVKASSTFVAHTATVEDVAWHAKDAHVAGSVGDDKRMCLWDVRDPNKPMQNIMNAHESDINCIDFNPENEFLVATGSADSSIHVWDLRNLTQPISKLLSHTDQVFKVEWSPFNPSILGSCSADRRVGLWDLSRIGQEQTAEDAQDGPPELLFLHGGHTSKVSDFSWNQKNHWSIASVSEDNVLQVWNIAEEIYAGDDDDDNNEDANAEDGVLEDDDLE